MKLNITRPDPSLPLEVYNEQVEKLIVACKEQESLIPVPLTASIMTINIFLHKFLDCSSCEAKCCKENMSYDKSPSANHIAMLEEEEKKIERLLNYSQVNQLKKAIKREVVSKEGTEVVGYTMPFPCILLNKYDNKCVAYQSRPVVCRIFPIGFMDGLAGENTVKLLGMNYNCPQSTNLLKITFARFYEYMQTLKSGQKA